MTWTLTVNGASYMDAYEAFEWTIPDEYNIARDFIRKHDDRKGKIALLQGYPDGRRETYSFHDVDVTTNQIANALSDIGIQRGDRVGIVVPQKPANLFTHIACWKMGAVSVPLSKLFGEPALRYRLKDCDVKVVIADESVISAVVSAAAECPSVTDVIQVDGDPDDDIVPFDSLVARASRRFELVDTGPETPATLLYTSGTTGPPKGVLHTHSVWLGQCPAYSMYYGQGDIDENFAEHGIVWGHADWAWIGTLGFTVFPAWHYGRPIVGYPMAGFDPELSFEIIEEFGVTHAMFVPTAFRMIMASGLDPTEYDLDLEVFMSGSEPVTAEIKGWVAEAFDAVDINETYGQTEITSPISNCTAWFEPKAGSMGKPVPGSDVTVAEPGTTEPVERGEIGELLLKRDTDRPGIFEEYWDRPDATSASQIDGWHRTGDLVRVDDEGYYWFETRDDDLIITGGYRISPRDIESAILEHDNVIQVGVIGVPDEERNEVIKAFVEHAMDDPDQLAEEIRTLARERVAEFAYPREIEFVSSLPKTVTGKIKRNELREGEGLET